MHNRSRITVAPNMMYRSGKGIPYSHGTPVDVVPTTAGIPSTLNPLLRYYREFQSHSHRNTAGTAVIPQIPRSCHTLLTFSQGGRPHTKYRKKWISPSPLWWLSYATILVWSLWRDTTRKSCWMTPTAMPDLWSQNIHDLHPVNSGA